MFQTYLGITITDAWKVYRHFLGDKCEIKSISINSFANILCKSLLSNKVRRHKNRKVPKPTNRQIDTLNTSSRRELDMDVPDELIPKSTRALSSLGSISMHWKRKIRTCGIRASSQGRDMYHYHSIVDRGSFADKIRKRKKCRECRKNTRWMCSVCRFVLCSHDKACFTTHKTERIQNERDSFWASMQTN